MPRNTEKFNFEIIRAVETIQKQGKTIIPRKMIEDEIAVHPEKYPNIGQLHDIPLKIVISAVINRTPGAEVFRKRPLSWTISEVPAYA